MTNNRFTKGVGTFNCIVCGKLTRNSTGDNANDESCASCIEQMQKENAAQDGE